jgi:aminoglycoside phosphotransferase (APT) family kinase protein
VIPAGTAIPESTATAPPPAEGRRLPWSALPGHLRTQVEQMLGGRVLAATTQPGGFSPGIAARVILENGRRAFVKAVGDINPDAPRLHRAEARIAAALPPGTPAPRLLGCVDAEGWVILAFEDVDGQLPAQPWRDDQLMRVLAATTDLARRLTPAPIDVPPAATRYHTLGQGWQLLANDAGSGADDLAGVDPWVREHLTDVVGLEHGWEDAVNGATLAHGDVRADNTLLTPDRVVFVDWPWACLAPPWFDLIAMLPSVTMNGGPSPEDVLAVHSPDGADPDAVTTVVAALAGTWTYLGRRPDPPGLPTLRAFQQAQAAVALRWLRQRIRA